MELTRAIASRCHDISYDQLGDEVRDRVKYLLLDYLGVAIRGTLSESSTPVHRFIAKRPVGNNGVPIVGTAMLADVPYSALGMGVASHSLELDDVVNAASLHPAVAVMSAALAVGYHYGCSGKTLIEAIVAGYEVTVKLGIAIDPAAHYAQGFHPTGTCGTFGAAITTAKILGLDVDTTINALGIAGSQAAGSLEFLADGSFTKRFHAGWAALSGINAALLAAEGFTGPASIIEGRFGFLHAYSGKSDPAKVLANWGEPYEVLNTSIKPHACCRYKQGAIDCILQIMKEEKLSIDNIARIEAAILKAGFALVAEPRQAKLEPKSVVDAQFSMPFGAAVAILKGNAFLNQYCLENIDSEQVKALMPLVHCVENDEIEKEFPKRWPARVNVVMKDGTSHARQLQYPKGDPENPLSWDELITKFKSLAGDVFDSERLGVIVDRVRALDDCQTVDELMRQMRTAD